MLLQERWVWLRDTMVVRKIELCVGWLVHGWFWDLEVFESRQEDNDAVDK